MNEFQPLSEDDIFDCIIVISNNHTVLEDAKQRCVNQIFWAVKNSKNKYERRLEQIFT